jgi:hypothetical protein
MYLTPEYRNWAGMKSRCYNTRSPGYDLYGGRGIEVCVRWHEFINFFADMGQRPTPGHSIDRIDGSKGYSPSNCRWATDAEQARNTTRNVKATIDGVTKTLSEWARYAQLDNTTIGYRWRKGLRGEALVAPKKPGVGRPLGGKQKPTCPKP